MAPRCALALLLALAAPAAASSHHHSTPRAKKLLDKSHGSLALEVVAVDAAQSRVTVTVSGVDRAPAARLFVFHDDKDRHFIALDVHCEAAEQRIRCVLDYPPPYIDANVQKVTVHLHGREIAAPEEQVKAAFAAARAPAAAAAAPSKGPPASAAAPKSAPASAAAPSKGPPASAAAPKSAPAAPPPAARIAQPPRRDGGAL
jgi:hypothetical protein